MSLLLNFVHKRRVWIAAGLVVTALAALSALAQRTRSSASGPLEERRVTRLIYGLGTLEADRVFNLRLGINARLERVFVAEGDRVTPGMLLVDFDNIPAIRSPIAGVVTALHYRSGETAFAGQAVLTVTNLEDVVIQVGLEERAAVLVRPGQPARLRFDALGDRRFDGQVRSIYPGDGQFIVRITPPANMPAGLLPGMTADVAIETRSEPGLVAPVDALPPEGPQELEVLRDGRGTRVPVTVLIRGDDGVAVQATEGELRAGDIVRWSHAR